MPETALALITVEVGNPPEVVKFIGRWLVEPDPRETCGGDDAGGYWGVALTGEAGWIPPAQAVSSGGFIPTAMAAKAPRVTDAGQFAVYWQHVDGVRAAHLTFYAELSSAAAAGVPEEFLSQAASECGQDYPVRRDS